MYTYLLLVLGKTKFQFATMVANRGQKHQITSRRVSHGFGAISSARGVPAPAEMWQEGNAGASNLLPVAPGLTREGYIEREQGSASPC